MSFDSFWLGQQFPDIAGLGPIGKGGQKFVFGGTHPVDGEVVVKVFLPNTDPDRAKREVEAARKVLSPRIPQVFELGVAPSPLGDVIWLREQRIAGEDLRTVLTRGPLYPRDAIKLALHMLEALVAAEQVRIVHRDVKPDNVIRAADDNFWLLDFGLARHLDLVSLTATAATFGCGTPGYAPTEQFRNQKGEIDARAELFGLGVTLFESVEGVNPFRSGARDVGEVLRRVEKMPLPAISKQIDSQNQFRDLVLAMTRARRDQRLPSAADALIWIQEICSREGVS